MADSLGRDVVVVPEEWDSIENTLQDVDEKVRTLLNDYLSALNLLYESGFVKGTRHDNIGVIVEAVEGISTDLDGVYETAKQAIDQLQTDSDSADKYKSLFNLGGLL